MTDKFKRTVESLFDCWTVGHRLGDGATSTVWSLYSNANRHHTSALKVIPASRVPPDKALGEYTTTGLMKAQSDYICTVYGAKKHGDSVFIHMERLNRIEIPTAEDASPNSVIPKVVKLGHDILLALDAIHGEHMAHLDIKPGNIMVSQGRGANRHYKLCDFGLAQYENVASNGSYIVRVGTPNYMAPELWHEGLDANSGSLHLCDLFSLGITLYKLLNCDRLPFEDGAGINSDKAFDLRMEPDFDPDTGKPEPLPPPRFTNDDLTKFLQKLTAYDPSDRYENAADALKDLTEIYQKLEADPLFVPVYVRDFPEETAQSKPTIPPELRLKGYTPNAANPFVRKNRKKELALICDCLRPGKPIFVNGEGGVGKTVVAVAAADCMRERAQISEPFLIQFDGSMRKTVTNLEFVDHNFTPSAAAADSIAQYEQEKYDDTLRQLSLYYTHALLIIDNFDSDEKSFDTLRSEEAFNDLVRSGIRLIFTTRFASEDTSDYRIKTLPPEELLELMRHYAPKYCKASDNELYQVIEAVGYHTLMVILIAKTIEASFGDLSAQQVLDALHRTGDCESLPDIASDYSGHKEDTIISHLKALFDISGLPEAARRVMSYACLLPAEGMRVDDFRACLSKEERNCLNRLTQRGWIEDVGGDPPIFQMHPIVCAAFRKQMLPKKINYAPFLSRLQARLCDNSPNELLLPAAKVFSDGATLDSYDGNDKKMGWLSLSASLYLKAGRFHEALARDLLCLPAFKNGEHSARMVRAATQNLAYQCDSEQEVKELATFVFNRLLQLNSIDETVDISKAKLSDLFSTGDYFHFLETCNTVLHRIRDIPEKSYAICSVLAAVYARVGMNTTAICYISQGLELCGKERSTAPARASRIPIDESNFLTIMSDIFKNEGNLRKQSEYALAAVYHLEEYLHSPADPEKPDADRKHLEIVYIGKCSLAGLVLCLLNNRSGAIELLKKAEAVMNSRPHTVYAIRSYDMLKQELETAGR